MKTFKTFCEGKWDYPNDIKGSKPSVYWDAGNTKKKAARKAHRKAMKAKAHAALKSGQKMEEDVAAMNTGAGPGMGDDPQAWPRKKRQKTTITKHYIEVNGKRKKRLKEETKKDDMKCNKPKAQAQGDKSHVVKACDNGKEKLIRFGQKGVKGSPPKKDESDSYTARRKAFKARHAKNIKKGKMSAAYWADKVKW